ncbi:MULTISPECIES: hypothetical protein [Bacillus cereus group]|uniref:hypothetical protein n=1 Tax=Bacillus cereus group TaxID=86661 RepID=UPI003017A299
MQKENLINGMTLEEMKRIVLEAEGGQFITEEARKRNEEFGELAQTPEDTRAFSWQHIMNHMEVSEHMTPNQKGALLYLATFLKIGKCGELLKKASTLTDVSKLFERTTEATRKILRECEKVGAVELTKVKGRYQITFTDLLYSCGKRGKVKDTHVKLFKREMQDYAKKLELNELGLLADMLAYFHKDLHILCENPTEDDIEKVRVYKPTKVFEKLGYDKDFVRKALKKFNDIGITLEIKTLGIKVVCLSPEIVSRKGRMVTIADIKKVASLHRLTTKHYV